MLHDPDMVFIIKMLGWSAAGFLAVLWLMILFMITTGNAKDLF